MKTILLDIGGTFIKRSDGRQFPISSDGSRDAIADAIRKAIGPTDGLDGIGMAIPGPFDYQRGIFRMEHKFAAVNGEAFRELAGIPDRIVLRFHHDVNAVLLGALRMLKLDNAALVTLGTGLGFAYAVNGQVQYNDKGSPARSLWNLPCQGGILEDFASARGIRIAYARMTGDGFQSAHSVAHKAYAGEAAAQTVYQRMGELLGEHLRSLQEELGFTTLLMGGQVSKSLDLFLGGIREALPGVTIRQAPDGAVFEGLSSLFEKQ